MIGRKIYIICFVLMFAIYANAAIPNFTAPDTVCRGQNITISNTTTGQNTNLWNFCSQQLIQGVTGVNLGSISGMPARPHGIEIYKEGNNYIGFLGNDGLVTGTSYPIVRLNFGSSILNIPTTTAMPSFTENVTPRFLRFIKEGTDWYAIVAGQKISYQPAVTILKFGNSLMNTPSVYNDLGNMGGLINVSNLTGIALEKSGSNVVAFVTSAEGRLFRINFGTTITNLNPAGVDLGNFGVLTVNNRFKLIQQNGNWYGFTANDGYPNSPTNDKLFRLSFGSSLLTTPIVTNLGNPNNKMNRIYDLLPYNDCETVKLLGVNVGNSEIISFSFPLGITTNQVSGVSFGNIGSLAQPTGLSQVIVENGNKYVFIANSQTNSLTRLLIEPACTPVGVSSSNLINPPVFTLNTLGTITVSLTIDKNLATEASTCQEIVVIDTIKKPDARINTITCSTDSIRLTIANIDSTATYSWSGPNGFTSIKPNVSIKFNGNNTQNGNYIVTTTGRCGIKKDTVIVNANCVVCIPNFTSPDTVCVGTRVTITNQTGCGATNEWNFCKQQLIQGATGVNLGALANMPNRPHGIRIFKEGTDWIGFVGNDAALPGTPIRRLLFGNSLLNTPTVQILPSFAPTTIPRYVDFIKEGTDWYAITIGGNSTQYQDVLIIKFGNSLLNTPTLYRDLGNLGGLIGSTETMSGVSFEKMGNTLISFVTTSDGTGRIYRINFGTTITNPTPSYLNMGSFGLLKYNHFVKVINVNNQYYGFTSNDQPDNNLIRFDFGNSLLNIPSATNLGNPNGIMNRVYDLLPYNDCESVKLLGLNLGANQLISFLFPQGIGANQVNATSLGNIGNLNVNVGFSQLLLESGRKFVFVTNAGNNTISRINVEPICSPIGVASSTQINPPVFTADSVGTMTVSLTIDKNLSTELSTCREIIVVDSIKKPDARINTITCSTDSIRLTVANIDATATYSWIGPNGFTSTRPNVSIKFTGASQAGQYIVTSSGRCGSKKDTVAFIAPTPFVVNLGRDTSICQGNSVMLNATTSGTTVTYLWSTGAVTPSISVNQTGTYWVKVTSDGCSASDTIKVTILTAPNTFSIGSDTTYCGSFSRVLSTGNANTVWSTGVTSSQITVTQAGTYIATITNSCGSKKDTIVIQQNNIPLVNLGRDTNICQGNSVTLNATTSGTTVTYLWSTGAVTPSISVNQTGTYFVKVTADGCSASDTIKVTILTPPNTFSIGNDTTYCGSFTRILSTGNANTVWSTGVTSSQITITQAGTYIATITNSCGSEIDTIEIQDNIIPSVYINKDTVICDGNIIELSAVTDAQKYVWNTGDTTKNINISQHGIYWVEVSNNNCLATDTAFIDECEGDLWVPNAFTPNNDKTNDVFQVFGKRLIEYHLIVFNRWGEKLFESYDINNSWDGTQKGELVQVDAYAWVIFYKINLEGRVQDKMKKGTVAVLR